MSAEKERFTGLYRAAVVIAKVLFHTIFPVRYHEVERAQMDAPFVLIGNHNSMLDPMVVGLPCKRYQIRFLGKNELTKNWFLRRMFERLKMIAVSRHHTNMTAVRACLKTLKKKHVLGIFPEGTRHKTTVMEEMESGVAMIALRGNAPLLPAYITGKPRFLRRVDCYFGEPIDLSDLRARGIDKETCDETMQRIAQVYRDMIEMHKNSTKSQK